MRYDDELAIKAEGFTGSNSWLKGDERSVGDDNDDDHTGDDSKHLIQ